MGVVVVTDIPYLEPLLFWLRRDETLKRYFSDKSFFMPHNNLISATEEAMNKDCPAPRALWILPQDTLAGNAPANCKRPGLHTFYIQVIVQCIRDQFQIINKDGELKLEGQYMELAQARYAVKESVRAFNKQNDSNISRKFEGVNWVKDMNLYPDNENAFLATALEYEVKIF